MPRIIGHLDMDAFFAAIEERDTPRFRGLPLVVGADPQDGYGRGVVSTANYPARVYGIHSAMPISTAWRLSQAAMRRGEPATIFLTGSYRKYEEVSNRIMAILRGSVSVVQQRSVDEAYIDLSHTGSLEHAADVCRALKEEIRRQERLTASVGIGPNKLIAKIASDFQKPDGLTIVEEKNVQAFLDALPVRKIPGIGPKTETLLTRRGIRRVSDLRNVSRDDLHHLFGKWGLALYEKVRGQDSSPLRESVSVKSISEQHTFFQDTLASSIIGECLTRLCGDVYRRLSNERFRSFRTVTLTIRFFDFRTVSRSRTRPAPLRTLRDLHREALALLLPFLDTRENPRRELLRLIGVRVERLS